MRNKTARRMAGEGLTNRAGALFEAYFLPVEGTITLTEQERPVDYGRAFLYFVETVNREGGNGMTPAQVAASQWKGHDWSQDNERTVRRNRHSIPGGSVRVLCSGSRHEIIWNARGAIKLLHHPRGNRQAVETLKMLGDETCGCLQFLEEVRKHLKGFPNKISSRQTNGVFRPLVLAQSAVVQRTKQRGNWNDTKVPDGLYSRRLTNDEQGRRFREKAKTRLHEHLSGVAGANMIAAGRRLFHGIDNVSADVVMSRATHFMAVHMETYGFEEHFSDPVARITASVSSVTPLLHRRGFGRVGEWVVLDGREEGNELLLHVARFIIDAQEELEGFNANRPEWTRWRTESRVAIGRRLNGKPVLVDPKSGALLDGLHRTGEPRAQQLSQLARPGLSVSPRRSRPGAGRNPAP